MGLHPFTPHLDFIQYNLTKFKFDILRKHFKFRDMLSKLNRILKSMAACLKSTEPLLYFIIVFRNCIVSCPVNKTIAQSLHYMQDL